MNRLPTPSQINEALRIHDEHEPIDPDTLDVFVAAAGFVSDRYQDCRICDGEGWVPPNGNCDACGGVGVEPTEAATEACAKGYYEWRFNERRIPWGQVSEAHKSVLRLEARAVLMELWKDVS